MGYAPQNHLLNILCQGDAVCLVRSIVGGTHITEMKARHQKMRNNLRFKERICEENIK